VSKVTYERELLEMEFFPEKEVQTMRTPDGLTKSMAKMEVSVVQDLKTFYVPSFLVGREAWDLVLPVD